MPLAADDPVAGPHRGVVAGAGAIRLDRWPEPWRLMFLWRRARQPPSRITPSARSGRTPQLKRDLLCDTMSRGNDVLPRDFCSAGTTPDLRSRPLGGGTRDHSHARVTGVCITLRPSFFLSLSDALCSAI